LDYIRAASVVSQCQDHYNSIMTTLPNGTYYIINKTTGRYANMASGVATPYTPVIAWNDQEILDDNVKWVLTSVGGNIYTIRSKLDANAYASVAIHIQGGTVANATRSERYDIIQVTGGGYRINLTGYGIGWAHLNSTDADGIKIKLQPTGTANDVWNITPTT